MSAPLKHRQCGHCRSSFYVCRKCDRGQAYCKDACRTEGYRNRRRSANATHRKSPDGRADDRDRHREYRRRKKERAEQNAVTETFVMDNASSKSICTGISPPASTTPMKGALQVGAKENERERNLHPPRQPPTAHPPERGSSPPKMPCSAPRKVVEGRKVHPPPSIRPRWLPRCIVCGAEADFSVGS